MQRALTLLICLAWLASVFQPAAAGQPASPGQPAAAGPPARSLAPEPAIGIPEPEQPGTNQVGSPADAPPELVYSPRIAGIIDQITSSDLYSYTGSLSGEWPVYVGGEPYTFVTRYSYSGEPIAKATQYVSETLKGFGLAPWYQEYTYNPGGGTIYHLQNVLAEQTGTHQPERVVMITAHLDDMPWEGAAPGADDNASGTAAVLAAAQVLSQYNPACTVRYALFTGEEQGLVGSRNYALSLANQGASLAGVLNLDMIGYESDGNPVVDLFTTTQIPETLSLAQTMAGVIYTYGLDLAPLIIQGNHLSGYYMGNYSDNKAFWDYGYPAILTIEDFSNDDDTPYYHTSLDTLSTLNMAYFTEVTRAAVGALAHLGCLSEPVAYLEGSVTAAGLGMPVEDAAVIASAPGLVYTTTTGVDGMYRMGVITGTYTLTVSAAGHAPHITPNLPLTAPVTTQDAALCQMVGGLGFTYAPSSPQSGQPVTFTAAVSAGSPLVSYTWDFGDGSQAQGLQATHTYLLESSGLQTRTVNLAAENACPSSASYSQEVLLGIEMQLFLPLVSQNRGEFRLTR